MSLSYVILVHKNPTQLALLFDAVYHAEDTFVLHVDRKASLELHRCAAALAARFPNLRVLPSRNIEWGGPEMVEVQLEAAKLAAERNAGWSHCVNLTGQDLPLQPREHILSFLAEHSRQSFLEWFDPLQTGCWGVPCYRISRYYFDSPLLKRLWTIKGLGRRLRSALGWRWTQEYLPLYQRKAPFFKFMGGWNHFVLSRAAVDYLAWDPRSLRIRRWLRHSMHTDDIAVQSILLDSPLRDTLVNELLWKRSFRPGAYHPEILTTADLPRLLSSGKPWARKFDIEVDPEVVRLLCERVRRKQGVVLV